MISTVLLTLTARAKDKSTFEARKPNAASVTAEMLARKFLDVAETMAQARAEDQVCELSVFEGDLLAAYRNAKNFDPTLRASAAIQHELKANLGFKLLEEGINITAVKDGTPAVMAGTMYWGGGGMYPFVLTLLPGGKAQYNYYVDDSSAGDMKPIQVNGTWSFKTGSSKKHPNPVLITTLPLSSGGKMKTKSYVVAQDDFGGFGLYPSYAYKATSNDNFPSFTSTHYECE